MEPNAGTGGGKTPFITACQNIIIAVTALDIAATGVGFFLGLRDEAKRDSVLVWIIVFFTSAIILLSLYSFFKREREKILTLGYFSNAIYSLNKKIRDELYHLECLFENEELTSNIVNSKIRSTSKEVINYLEKLLSKYCDADISVCVKYFDTRDLYSTDIDSTGLITLCRSDNTHPDRSQFDHIPVKIKDNSDFQRIMELGKSYFAVTNIRKYSRKKANDPLKKYKNSSENWGKYYNSTIVVPIRLRKDLLPLSRIYYNISGDYHIMGFLCMDTLDKYAFNGNNMEYLVYLAKGFGNLLYIYFEQCFNCQLKLEERDDQAWG